MMPVSSGGRMRRCSSCWKNFSSQELRSLTRRRGEPAREQWPARGVTGEHQVHLSPPLLFATAFFAASSSSVPCLEAGHRLAPSVGLPGRGEPSGCFPSGCERAVQTHLKKHSSRDFSLPDLTRFVLRRFKSTPFIFITF